MIRGHTSLSPSGPKTKDEPTNAKSSSRLIAPPSVWNIRWPAPVFSTMQREQDLQREAPGDRPPVDGAPVGRQRVGDRQDDDQADERLQPRHAAELREPRRAQRPRPRTPSTTTSRRSNGARDGRRLARSLGHRLACTDPAAVMRIAGFARQRRSASAAGVADARSAASSSASASSRPRPRAMADHRAPDRRAATWSRRGATTAMPTPGSTTSSSRSRPAPSATAARPISSARRP